MMLKTGRAAAIVMLVCVAAGLATGQEWRERIDSVLLIKKSYDFKETAIADIAKVLAQDMEVNVVLDPSVDRTQKLTLKLRTMTYANVLTWLARLADLEWCVKDEAIMLAPAVKLAEDEKLQIEGRRSRDKATAAKTWLVNFRKVLEEKISVEFNMKPIVECMETLEVILDVDVIVSPDVDARKRVTLSVTEMGVESVLSWVARNAGVDYAVTDEVIYFAPEAEIRMLRVAGMDFSSRGKESGTVSFDFAGTPFREAVEYLSTESKTRIEIRSRVESLPAVTLKGSDMALTAALQALTNATGLHSAIVREEDGIVISIIAPGKAAEVKVEEVKEPAKVDESGAEDGGSGESTPVEGADEAGEGEAVPESVEQAE